MDLAGRVGIVTGGTGGLGQRLCRALAGAGVAVAVVYERSQEKAEALADELRQEGGRALAVQANVAAPEAAQRAVAEVAAAFGRVDLLVNDAAYNFFVPFPELESLTPELWDRILGVNLKGPFLFAQAAAPLMKRQGEGRIVNITSIAGLAPTGSSIAYAVSKAGLIHLTRCLAVALAPEVLVNSVAPGSMAETRMTANLSPEYVERARQGALTKRMVEKDDVVAQILTLLRSDSTTGQTICVDGGRFFH
ncbi:MAG: SDR family NAD(P)-dependent oxidoreductase [Chloroflexota bacterium]